MVKNHIKRLTVPTTWRIDKKSTVYVTRPRPGAHSLELGMSLNILFKDILGFCKTTKEVKAILQDKEILVDGKRRYDYKAIIGFMDVLSIPSQKQNYRIVLDDKGKLKAIKIKNNEAEVKPSKIMNKTILGKNKVQINLSDGRNLTLKGSKYAVGDSLLITVPKQEVKEHLKLDKGAIVTLLGGKFIGQVATIEEIKGDVILAKIGDKSIETIKKYCFVVGEKKPAIELSEKNEQNEGDKGSKSNS